MKDLLVKLLGFSSMHRLCRTLRNLPGCVRYLVLWLGIALIGSAALAASPAIMFPLDSFVYADLEALFISQGLSQPSTTKPWSKDEVGFFLEKLNTTQFSEVERELYDGIRLTIDEQKKVTSLGFQASLETYIHTNTDAFITEDDWVYSYSQRKPLISLPIDISLGSFYGFLDLSLSNRNFDEVDSDITDGISDLYGQMVLTTNLPFQWKGSEDQYLDAGIPYRAFLAVGGSGWFFQVGRERLSWGPGVSGNFMIGSHLQYHNQARLTAYRDSFTYSFLTSFFPHPNEIWDNNASSGQARELQGLKMFMAHRFEWRLLNDTLGIVLSEGIMYQHKDGVLDLRVLNPLMIYHNYYIRQNANSLASLEIDYALRKGLNMYGQIAVDELSFGSIEQNLPDDKKHPNGLAFMAGIKHARPIRQGILYAHLEGVYTDPYLYLRSIEGNTPHTEPYDTLNYIVALRRWNSDEVFYDQTYLGYRYGGDAIVLEGSLGFRVPGDWHVNGHLFTMVHGDVDMNTFWELGKLECSPTGNPTVYGQAGISAGKVLGRWSVHGSLDYLLRTQSSQTLHDVQLVLGATYSSR